MAAPALAFYDLDGKGLQHVFGEAPVDVRGQRRTVVTDERFRRLKRCSTVTFFCAVRAASPTWARALLLHRLPSLLPPDRRRPRHLNHSVPHGVNARRLQAD